MKQQQRHSGILFILVSLALLFPAARAAAQNDLGVHFMEGVWQSVYTNPAFQQHRNVLIAFPGAYNGFLSNRFTYADLVQTDDAGRQVPAPEAVIGQLQDHNVVWNQLDVHTFAIGFRLIGPNFLSFGHTFRTNTFINFPKTLPDLIWNGNAQYIDQVVNFGPDLLVQGYHEYWLGLSFDIASRVSVGGRIKVLNGVADLSSSRTGLNLYTNPEYYQLDLIADYTLNSTGAITYDGLDNLDFDLENGNFGGRDGFPDNLGAAFDLGIQVRFDRWAISGSILDIGSIKWKDEVTNFSLRGQYEYQGLDVFRQVITDSLPEVDLVDTLDQLYDFTQTRNSYRTRLPTRVYLSGTYQINDQLQAGALLYLQQFRALTFPALGLSLRYQPAKFFSIGGIYALRYGQADNLGLNTAFRAGPLQLVFATDNIINLFQPTAHHQANLRLGVNFVFGRPERRNPPEPLDTEGLFR